jgi:hypothetical protein
LEGLLGGKRTIGEVGDYKTRTRVGRCTALHPFYQNERERGQKGSSMFSSLEPRGKEEVKGCFEELTVFTLPSSCLGKDLCDYFSRRVPTSVAEWGIAGRDPIKLSTLKTTLQYNKDLEKLNTVVATCEDQDSILQMCSQAELVINCTSQNLRNCSVVVNACIENKTDYLDFTTDESIIAVLKEKYDERAKENEVLIVPGCVGILLPHLRISFWSLMVHLLRVVAGRPWGCFDAKPISSRSGASDPRFHRP